MDHADRGAASETVSLLTQTSCIALSNQWKGTGEEEGTENEQ